MRYWILGLGLVGALVAQKSSDDVRRAPPGDWVPVFVFLGHQPQRAIIAEEEAVENATDGENRTVNARRRAFARIQLALGGSQSIVEAVLRGIGARNVRRYSSINMLTAEVRPRDLAPVEASPLVDHIFLVPQLTTQLANSNLALGATTFWNVGITGAGQSVAVLDTGLTANHPAFAGVQVVNRSQLEFGSTSVCFSESLGSLGDQTGHGTHVSGIVASRGSAGWENYRGAARELASLYNVKIGYRQTTAGSCIGAGVADGRDILAGLDWLVQQTPVRVANLSFGGSTTADDSSYARAIDAIVDSYGLFLAVAAGNGSSCRINSPAIAFNVFAVGNFVSRGTMSASSCVGPTVGGRFKPDAAAPGTSIASTAHNWDAAGVADFVAFSGTSMAAPHIAGAAALLRQAGILDSLALRAVLINTTDNEGWAADRGWGYANLTTAQSQYANNATGTLTAAGGSAPFRLYEVNPGGRAKVTVAWNRHVPLGAVSALNDIDLYLYAKTTGTEIAASTTDVQNVEQVTATPGGAAIVKVSMFSTTLLGGVPSERFGVAFNSPSLARAGPALAPQCAVQGTAFAGAGFSLTCTVSNTGDLGAVSVTAAATLPAGFVGTADIPVGPVPAGATSAASTFSLTAPSAPGAHTITVVSTGTAFAETFRGQTQVSVSVSSQPPGTPSAPNPANGAAGVSLAPTLAWAPANGATSYDVHFGTAVNPPLVVNTGAATFLPGALVGGTTYFWRVMARNAGGTSNSPTWSFTTLTPLPFPGIAANPIPMPSSTGVASPATLGWSAATNAASYEVHFGASNPPPLVSTVTGLAYTTSSLAPNTTYYWRIVSRNSTGSTASDVWSFISAGTGTGPTVLAAGLGSPSAMALDEAYVYWTDSASKSVRRAPRVGGVTSILYTGTTATTGIAVDAASVYFGDGVAVRRIPKSGGAETALATSASARLAADNDSVYWTNSAAGTILKVSKSGGAVVTLSSGYSNPLGIRVQSDGFVYFTEASANGAVWRVRSSGGTAERIGSNSNSAGVEADASNAHWVDNTASGNGRIRSAVIGGVDVVTASGLATPIPDMASDPDYLYWVTNTATGTLSQMRTGGGGVASLATGLANPTTLLADSGFVYWMEGGGLLKRIPRASLPPPPGVPALTAPADQSTAVATNTALTWQAAIGASSYDVYLGTAFPPPAIGSVTSASYSPASLAPSTLYFWRIVAKGSSGSATSATRSFRTQVAAPSAPSLVSPANGAQGLGATLNLSWTAAGGADSYDVYFGTSTPPPLLQSSTTALSVQAGPIVAGAIHYWSVTARNVGGSSGSAVWWFNTATTNIGPTPPAITAPMAGEVVHVAATTLRWDPAPGATSYDLRVLEAATARAIFTGGLTGAGSTQTVVELPDGAFSFGVRTCSGSSCGNYTERAFSVAAAAPTGSPVVTWPQNGAALSQSTQSLQWTAVADATSYELLLTDAATARTELHLRLIGATSTIYSMPSSQRFDLKVRACLAACGPWSATASFSMSLPPAPSASPVGGANASGNVVSAFWSAVANADSYDVQAVQPPPAGPGGGALTVAGLRTSSLSVGLPVAVGTVAIFVAGCNGNGCGPYSAPAFTVATGQNPAVPTIAAPSAGSVVEGPAVVFTWNRVPGDNGSNTTYRLFVQDLARQSVAADILTTQNYWGVMLRGGGNQYGAQVIANPGTSQSAGPGTRFGVRGDSPLSPTPAAPTYLDRQVRAGNVIIRWTPVPGATLYEYRVGTVSRGVTPGLIVQVPLAAVGGAATRYVAIMRACPAGTTCTATSDVGWGPWSNLGGTGVATFDVVP